MAKRNQVNNNVKSVNSRLLLFAFVITVHFHSG